MGYLKPKLIGKDDDGDYIGRIEEIGTGKESDRLMICNLRSNCWVFGLFSGYRQIGVFDAKKPHDFEEDDIVIVTKKDDKIIAVGKDGDKKW